MRATLACRLSAATLAFLTYCRSEIYRPMEERAVWDVFSLGGIASTCGQGIMRYRLDDIWRGNQTRGELQAAFVRRRSAQVSEAIHFDIASNPPVHVLGADLCIGAARIPMRDLACFAFTFHVRSFVHWRPLSPPRKLTSLAN